MARYEKVGKGINITCSCSGRDHKRPHDTPIALAAIAKIDGERNVRLLRVAAAEGTNIAPNAVKLRKIPARSATASNDLGTITISIDEDSPGRFIRMHPSISCPCCGRNVRVAQVKDLNEAFALIVRQNVTHLDILTFRRILDAVNASN